MKTITYPIVYPESDGLPMADNTEQYEWITRIKSNLDIVFAQDAEVFVAGDLLWYPVEGNPKIRVAPDVLVAFGRPKGYRGSYLQWLEEGIAPQVVFEILSPGNHPLEMTRKLAFYERHGVQEYYVYDPLKFDFAAWIRQSDELRATKNAELRDWRSPLLGVSFAWNPTRTEPLRIYHPGGRPFSTSVELNRELAEARYDAQTEALRAEAEHQRAEAAQRQAETEHQRAEAEALRAEAEALRAEAERQRAERLAARLRQLGLDPDAV